MTGMTFDKERVSFNLARIKKGGKNFEIDIDFDQAISFKEGKISDIKSVLKVEQIFKDVKKGLQASETELQQLFDASDPLEVAKIIIEKGEIQLTQEYREQLREKKKKQIINIIHRNGVDPRTHSPHPPQRIKNALEEAHVNIKNTPIDSQIKDIISQIRKIIPIKIEEKKIKITIPSIHTGKAYGLINEYKEKEEWLSNGDLEITVNIPSGTSMNFYDKLNSLTHGSALTEEVKEDE